VNNPDVEPSVEVAHLRRLLEIQPGCLLRLRADGTILAASDAALRLVGAASGAEVLGRDSAAFISPSMRGSWRTFLAAVAGGGPASMECEILAPSGARHTALFHGVPIPDHPDGVPSVAVAARAVSAQRHLETALLGLEARLFERDAECAQALERLAEAEAKCARALEDLQQLEIALEAFASRQQMIMDACAAATADRDRLVRELRVYAARLDELADDVPAASGETAGDQSPAMPCDCPGGERP